MTGPTKLCFVLPSLNGGGAERAAVKILNALDEHRWHKSMYLFRREGPYLPEVRSSIELRSGAAGRSRFSRWNELRRFLAEWRPRLIVSFLSYFTVLTAARAAAAGRVVFNQQTPMSPFLADADYPWRGRWHRTAMSLATRVGYPLADGVITTSAGVAEDLASAFGVPRSLMHVIHNPVDMDAIASAMAEPLPPEYEARWLRPVIVSAGRLADAKNYPLLLEALAILRQTVPAKLFILGTGEREASIRALVSQLELTDAVTLCGFQANPWKFIARADVFALTSHYEGFGNVLVESLACGVPVVATSSPGTREIVTAANGELVERHDARTFAAALGAVLTDAARRAQLAAGASASAARFALPAIAADYDRVLGELAA